jgi:hypothetical protein
MLWPPLPGMEPPSVTLTTLWSRILHFQCKISYPDHSRLFTRIHDSLKGTSCQQNHTKLLLTEDGGKQDVTGLQLHKGKWNMVWSEVTVMTTDTARPNMNNRIANDAVHRLPQGVLSFRNVIRFHGNTCTCNFISITNPQMKSTTLCADFLYQISPKSNSECGKYGWKFVYGTK